ncbi:MAG: acyl-CoA dehydratase activase-related protein [Candidatus Geothermincolia bacterium]
MKVGIPRAMLFHHYGDGWLQFLESIGAEPVISEQTTSDIITTGATMADNETCLPVKVFSGHIMALKDKSDAILVPRVTSQEDGICSCPKFLGLPDLARTLDPDLPPILAPKMNLGGRHSSWAREWYTVARSLGAGRARSTCAVLRMLRWFEQQEEGPESDRLPEPDMSIGVAGHLYNVHDERVSLGLLDRLRDMGATPVTVDEVDQSDARRQAESLPRQVFWGFESRLAGAVLHWSRTREVSGILFVTSFACGPGSIVGALLEDQLQREGSVPLMTITLDEHAAEAGLVTRLEAFVDMLRHASRVSAARELALGGARL